MKNSLTVVPKGLVAKNLAMKFLYMPGFHLNYHLLISIICFKETEKEKEKKGR